jgi:DUF971 family protein
LTLAPQPWPLEIRVRRATGSVDIDFDTGERFKLSAPLLRAMTTSAADRGHGPSIEGPLPKPFTGVTVLDAHPVGAYAVRLVFSDGHDSGLYTWGAFHRIGCNQDRLSEEHRQATRAAA